MFGRAFMERAMPETALRLARVTAGADTLMAIPEAGVLMSSGQARSSVPRAPAARPSTAMGTALAPCPH